MIYFSNQKKLNFYVFELAFLILNYYYKALEYNSHTLIKYILVI